MRIVVSIVSHGNQPEILRSGLVDSLSGLQVILCENRPDCERLITVGSDFRQNLRIRGFGANHNRNFECAQLNDDDWFVICNPDILTDASQVVELLDRSEAEGEHLVAPLLWNNRTNSFDHNLRPRVTFFGLLLSFLGKPARSRYSPKILGDLQYSEWASGAFLAIKGGLYRELQGFDERYFMYMEDVDFCRRAKRDGVQVRVFPDIRLIHNAARQSRLAINRHFGHHIRSVLRYFVLK